jgi:hypothetical protein
MNENAYSARKWETERVLHKIILQPLLYNKQSLNIHQEQFHAGEGKEKPEQNKTDDE